MPKLTENVPQQSPASSGSSPGKTREEREEGLTSKGLQRLQSNMRATCGVLSVILLGGIVVACVEFSGHAAAALLWISACLVIGGITGFLFAIPRVRAPAKRSEGTGSSASREAPEPSGTERGLGLGINTNLEEISDWLTKILVGLGLVELGRAPEYLQRAGYYIGQGLGDNRQSTAAGMVVFFLGLGFLCGYLLTRMFVGPAFRLADQATALGVAEDVAQALDLAETAKREGAITRRLYDVLDAAFGELMSASIRQAASADQRGKEASGLPRAVAVRYIEALKTFLNELGDDPQWSLHRRSHLLLAGLYKRIGDLDSAIAVVTAFVNRKKAHNEIDMHTADALYNRACYEALKFEEATGAKATEWKKRSLADLRESLLISPENAAGSQTDDDFKSLRDDPDFKGIVGPA